MFKWRLEEVAEAVECVACKFKWQRVFVRGDGTVVCLWCVTDILKDVTGDSTISDVLMDCHPYNCSCRACEITEQLAEAERLELEFES